jgi:hypothetical protein
VPAVPVDVATADEEFAATSILVLVPPLILYVILSGIACGFVNVTTGATSF